MKNILKLYFPLILTVLSVFFILQFLFHGLADTSSNLFVAIGNNYTDAKQKDNRSLVAQKEGAQPKAPLPSIAYTGGTLITGEDFSFPKLFTLTYFDGTVLSLDAATTAAIYLKDIRNKENDSVLTRLTSMEIKDLEELPSPSVYDTDKQLLYFYQNGIYHLTLQLFIDGEDGIYFTCNIPVEVN